MKLSLIIGFLFFILSTSNLRSESDSVNLDITCTFDRVAFQTGVVANHPSSFPPFKILWKIGEPKAFLIGNAGKIEVMATIGDDSINFIQLEPIVTTTTINLKTSEVVHSRNTILMGNLVPSQYYGMSTALED